MPHGIVPRLAPARGDLKLSAQMTLSSVVLQVLRASARRFRPALIRVVMSSRQLISIPPATA
jgi:hypothetical protein